MAKRKMLQWMRDKLSSELHEIVKPINESAALDAAYKKAAPLVIKAVQEKYPLRDMRICEKYNAAQIDDCIQLQLSDGGVEQFQFEEKTGPLVVMNRSCRYRMYLADEVTSAAVVAWVAARDARKAEFNKRIQAYRALIAAATTVDDLLEVWPEAASIIPEANSVLALGPEQIALVKADLAERKAA